MVYGSCLHIMRIVKCLFLLSVLTLGCIACTDLFVGQANEPTPEETFEQLWQDYDKYYSYFPIKNINWDSMYTVYRPQVTRRTTPDELFQITGKLILSLRDGHAWLVTPQGRQIQYKYPVAGPTNRLPSLDHYFSLKQKNFSVYYGTYQNIGYVLIQSLSGPTETFSCLDDILLEFKQQDLIGLVLDLRGNGGGSDEVSRLIASRFVSTKSTYSLVRYKAGPAHNSFGEWMEKTISPSGEHFSKPVMVLTNRQIFSSAEDLVLAMRTSPNTTVVGDTTGGGSGNPMLRLLPNGWNYAIPRWQQVDMQMEYIEGRGIHPDIPLWITSQDSIRHIDAIFERAVVEIKKK